jgi:stress-induced morphogen
MVSTTEIRQCVETALPGARVQVEDTTGAGDHFELRVVTPAFAGKGLVEQHQIVYRALGALMSRIHALSLRTQVPEETTR